MNYEKIQIKALKSVGTYNPWKSIETEDITYLVDGDGFELYAIPNKELIINPKTLGNKNLCIEEIISDSEDATLDRNAVYLLKDKKLILIFKNSEGEKLHVDNKLLKGFEIHKTGHTYKGNFKKRVLSIYENGVYVGTVCGTLANDNRREV